MKQPGFDIRRSVRIRPAVASDRDFLSSIVPRLREFGAPPLRPVEDLDRAERRALELALDAPQPDSILLVAELDQGPVGVAYAHSATDYFTGEHHGHLGILAVTAAAEGRGAGHALIEAVERWSAEQGYRILTLNVFFDNERARRVYERAGFRPDTIRYARELPRGES